MIPEFSKYRSLTLIRENRPEELQKYKDLTHGERFVLTEKIHGSNFQAVTDGQQVTYGRRNGYLGEGASFYGYQYVAEALGPKMLEMFKDMKEMVMEQHRVCDLIEAEGQPCNRPEIPRDFQTITIRGELAGGHYPAKGVPVVKTGHGQVGKGKIWYSQDKSFYAFEMLVDGEPVDFYTLGSVCGSYGIPVVPVLMFGSFEECLEFSKERLEDNTLVPTMQPLLDADGNPTLDDNGLYVGLPEIEGNQREGHVIMAVTPFDLPNGKPAIFKHKGAKFMENKGDKAPRSKKHTPVVFTEEQSVVFESVLPLICEARLEAVCSKEQLTEPKQFTQAIGLVVKDAIDEAHGDAPNDFFHAWTRLSTKERKYVTGQLNREACERLRSHYFA